ncbi:MAG TPA: sigma-70 family RNA polymerase sigma factor [Solirubrobacterales bacterium]|nr:sigma-70 family RNA polymerase sigma factor [Solirubrobacterales bacterium]
MREGYEAAFEEIVRRYGRPLGRYAASIVGGRSEDVLQDAFAKALPALRRAGADIDLRPWLFRIVRNTALNDLRDSPPSPELLAEALAGGRNPADELERREELTDLMRRLQALPEPQRAAIVMRELEGLGHEEIAAALGLTGGGARQAIYRARQALRDGAGVLLPLPLVRLLAAYGGGAAEAGTGGAIAAAGASAGGAGVGGAIKIGAVAAVIAGSLGAGVAVHDQRKDDAVGSHAAPAALRATLDRAPPASAKLADAVLPSAPYRSVRARHLAAGADSDDNSDAMHGDRPAQIGGHLQSSGEGPGRSSGSGRRQGEDGERRGGLSGGDSNDGAPGRGGPGGGGGPGQEGGSDGLDELRSPGSSGSGTGGNDFGGNDGSSEGTSGDSGPGGGGSDSDEGPDSVASPLPPEETTSEDRDGSGGSGDGGQAYESP